MTENIQEKVLQMFFLDKVRLSHLLVKYNVLQLPCRLLSSFVDTFRGYWGIWNKKNILQIIEQQEFFPVYSFPKQVTAKGNSPENI